MGTQTGYYEYFARGAKLPTTALQDVGPLAIAETIMIISIGTRAAEPGARAAAGASWARGVVVAQQRTQCCSARSTVRYSAES